MAKSNAWSCQLRKIKAQNPKKKNFEENVWLWLKRCFFLAFLDSLFFCFENQKTKTLVFLVFLRYWLIVHRPKKTKKLKVFLFFGFYCFGFMWIEKLKTKKNIEFFAVWGLVNSTFMKKNTNVFCFLTFKTPKKNEKNSRNTKKTIFWVKTKHSPQSLGFFVFVFLVLCLDLPQLAA